LRFKVITLGQHFVTKQLFLQDLHEVQKVFRSSGADVIHIVRRNRQAILAAFLIRCALNHANDVLNDTVHIGEVTLTVAVVEDLYSFP
jgi:hypothetical protein